MAANVRRALLAVACPLVVILGCGDDEAESPESVLTTERPELAYFTAGPDRSDPYHGEALYDIGLADAQGESHRLLTGESVPHSIVPNLFTAISWAPDGTRLALGGGTGEQQGGFDDESDIYTVAADGSELEQVTDLGDATHPLFSPDGKTIVFSRLSFGEGEPLRGALWSVGLDGSDPEQLTEDEDWQTDYGGSFSPDGSEIAFTRTLLDPATGKADHSIRLVRLDASTDRLLIDDGSDPAFSPDGESLAFVSDRDQNGELCYGDRCLFGGELYVADADGGHPQRLTETNALNEASPSWLGDGSRIAYQRGEQFENAEAMSVLQVNPDGTCSQEVLPGRGPGRWYASPAWRPSDFASGGGGLDC
jgi:Tol biopolymer transport system component